MACKYFLHPSLFPNQHGFLKQRNYTHVLQIPGLWLHQIKRCLSIALLQHRLLFIEPKTDSTKPKPSSQLQLFSLLIVEYYSNGRAFDHHICSICLKLLAPRVQYQYEDCSFCIVCHYQNLSLYFSLVHDFEEDQLYYYHVLARREKSLDILPSSDDENDSY